MPVQDPVRFIFHVRASKQIRTRVACEVSLSKDSEVITKRWQFVFDWKVISKRGARLHCVVHDKYVSLLGIKYAKNQNAQEGEVEENREKWRVKSMRNGGKA